jgi:RNA polymerase sigma-70 factor (ECF subfamily)
MALPGRGTPEAEDLELLRRCQQGDPLALQGLYDRHHKLVYDLAFRMLGSHEDAEELVTEAFLRLWRGCHSFKGRCRVTTWIYQITSNRCLDRLRSRRSRKSLALEDIAAPETLADYQAPERDQPEETFLREEQARHLHSALNRLPEEDRLLVTLYHLQGCSYEEIQEITRIKPTNIKSKLYRARQRLKQHLSALEEEADHGLQPGKDSAGGLLCSATVHP